MTPNESLESGPRSCLMAVTGIFSTGGGIAAVNRLVIRSLIEAGYHIDVLSLIEDSVHLPDYANSQIGYQVFRGSKSGFARALWRAQRLQRYSLVFCDHINVATALAPSALLLRRPYTVWVHGTEVFAPGPSWEGRIGLRLAALRLTSSAFTEQVVSRLLPARATRACDLALEPDRWGFSLPQGAPLKQPVSLQFEAVDGVQRALGEQVILHTGRMVANQRHKGHLVMLHAFEAVVDQHPQAQLVLAGSGNDYQYLLALAQSLPPHVRSAIFMPGFVSDETLTALYRGCHLFAMPSQAEGFGIVYLEAMRWARPCIGSRVDAASCVIVDGQTGLLVQDPRSTQEVAACINELLADSARANRLGRSGYERVRAHYMFPDFRDRFLQAIQ